jgi:hypothetical protein
MTALEFNNSVSAWLDRSPRRGVAAPGPYKNLINRRRLVRPRKLLQHIISYLTGLFPGTKPAV